MANYATKWTVMSLIRRGWNEIPEIMAASVMGLMGYGMVGYAAYKHLKYDGDNKRYKLTYVVMRPNDPRVAKIHKD